MNGQPTHHPNRWHGAGTAYAVRVVLRVLLALLLLCVGGGAVWLLGFADS
ncbi:MAG TPA: hypothetical protein VGD84_03580 [Pseudonocardiaceae bacterium]